MNISEIVKNPIVNCNYIAVNYDYTGYITINFIITLLLFFNFPLSDKYQYDSKKIDFYLKLILVIFNVSFFLLHFLTEILQQYLLSSGLII